MSKGVNYDLFEVFDNYHSIILNYLQFITENKYFINKPNYKSIIKRGIDGFTHIFTPFLI
jgi:hypothetical protein